MFDLFDDFDTDSFGDSYSYSMPGLDWIDGYFRDDNTFVSGHFRTMPDNFSFNNLSNW